MQHATEIIALFAVTVFAICLNFSGGNHLPVAARQSASISQSVR